MDGKSGLRVKCLGYLVGAVREEVLARFRAADIFRKRTFCTSRRQGNKRMLPFANVNLPEDAFLAALKL